jgi:tyrosinase
LYDATRQITATDAADPSYIGASVIENILSQTSFPLFASYPLSAPGYGMLEGTPHNNIHVFVCGDMCNFHSPLDPVFWMHHNMLDCLWVDWNINRGNPNTNDASWTGRAFTDFVDENGNPVSVPLVDTLLYPIFAYQFEPCAPGEHRPRLKGKDLERFLRTGAPSALTLTNRFEVKQSLTVAVEKPVTTAISVRAEAVAQALGAEGSRAILTIGDVAMPAKRDFFVRVFLGKADASPQTSIEDPHYAGSFGVFFDESAPSRGESAMTAAPNYVVDVTTALRGLRAGGSLSGPAVDVTLVAVPFARREAAGESLTLGRLELATTRF